jgi:hypothetical protein
MGVFMNYVVEMGLGAMIYIPSFIRIGSGIQKLIGRGMHVQPHRHTHRVEDDFINLV